MKRGISAATGTVSPLLAELHTSQRRPREELNPQEGKFSRDAALALEDSSPSPKQEQLQLAVIWCVEKNYIIKPGQAIIINIYIYIVLDLAG